MKSHRFGKAGLAQLAEQLICNQQVVGSNPTAGSMSYVPMPVNPEAATPAGYRAGSAGERIPPCEAQGAAGASRRTRMEPYQSAGKEMEETLVAPMPRLFVAKASASARLVL